MPTTKKPSVCERCHKPFQATVVTTHGIESYRQRLCQTCEDEFTQEAHQQRNKPTSRAKTHKQAAHRRQSHRWPTRTSAISNHSSTRVAIRDSQRMGRKDEEERESSGMRVHSFFDE